MVSASDEIFEAKLDELECLEDEKLAFVELLKQNADLFVSSVVPPGRTSTIEHHIDLDGKADPCCEPLRKYSPQKQEAISKKLKELLAEGVVQPSRNPWAAAVVIAPKKTPGQWRFAIDYRKLNNITKFDAYPMPRVDSAA